MSKRESTYRAYEKHMRLYIVPAPGGRQFRSVTRDVDGKTVHRAQIGLHYSARRSCAR